MTLHLPATPAIAATVLSLLTSLPLNAEIDPRRLSFHPERLPLTTQAVEPVTTGPQATPSTVTSPQPPVLAMADTQPPLIPDSAASTDASAFVPSPPSPVASPGAATLTRIQQRIAELEQHEGQYAPALADLHDALARLYLAQGEVEAGLASFQQARQIVRINNGLYAAAQVPLMREIIALNQELGRLDQATVQHEALLNLLLRHHGRNSLEAVPALLEWADWNVELYLDPRLQNDTTITIGTNMPGTLGLDYRNPVLQEAYARYVTALEILHQQDNMQDPRLVQIEHKLAALNYMANRDLTQAMDRMPLTFNGSLGVSEFDRLIDRGSALHFLNGSSALKRAVAYATAAEPPNSAAVAARMLELGDWYLLFNRRSSALQTYQEALQVLDAAGLMSQDIDYLVASGMPIQSFENLYQQPVSPAQYLGYVDVAFALDKYGVASSPRILAASPQDIDAAVERTLLQTIRASRFRPRFDADTAVAADTIQLRYFYTQGSQ